MRKGIISPNLRNLPQDNLTVAPCTSEAQCCRRDAENDAAGDVKRKSAPTPGRRKSERLARKGRECGKATAEPNGKREPHAFAPAEPRRQRAEKPNGETTERINPKRRPREEREGTVSPTKYLSTLPHPPARNTIIEFVISYHLKKILPLTCSFWGNRRKDCLSFCSFTILLTSRR